MTYIECPNRPEATDICMFLAGGIVGCPDWQKEMVELFKDSPIALLNPRRANFPIHDPNAQQQITWEFQMLRRANIIMFWFCKETICPIVLYECGAHSMTNKPIVIGMDPEYSRKQDVEIQTGLVRPDVQIVYTLKDVAEKVKDMDLYKTFVLSQLWR